MDLKFHKVRLLVNKMDHQVLQDLLQRPQDLQVVKMVLRTVHRQLQLCHSIKMVLLDRLLHNQDLHQVLLVLQDHQYLQQDHPRVKMVPH